MLLLIMTFSLCFGPWHLHYPSSADLVSMSTRFLYSLSYSKQCSSAGVSGKTYILQKVISYFNPSISLTGNKHTLLFVIHFFVFFWNSNRTRNAVNCSGYLCISTIFPAFLLFLQSTEMTNVIVNQCCAEASQPHAVPSGHPAFRRYACLPSVVIWTPAGIHNHWQVVRLLFSFYSEYKLITD